MTDPAEIGRFYERCSDLMRDLLVALASTPDSPRPFPSVEDALGWPRRRLASVLGGAGHLRAVQFGGRRPYRVREAHQTSSGRREIWCDRLQADAISAAIGNSGG